MNDGDLSDLLTILTSRGVSPPTVRRLVHATWSAGGSTRDALERLQRERSVSLPPKRCVREECRSITHLRLSAIDARATSFPSLLREIPDPPIALFVRGIATALAAPMGVAVVGSRRATVSGQLFASTLAHDLAQAKVVVVSGLAKGIDGAAHRGAVECGGVTVAVMGGGHSKTYPPSHHGLASRIADAGAVVSEYPPSAPAYPANFPERNRIISGLSAAVVVVEATQKSGSLITARLALEQGREVMAVPGAIEGGAHYGCHRLIRQGAALVESVADVLEGLGLTVPESSPLPPSSPRLQRILNAMVGSPTTVHDIVASLGVSVDDALRALVELELEGFVTPYRDGYIRRPLTRREP